LDTKLVKDLLGFLEAGRPVVLATVVDQAGSAPRTAGSRMIIGSDGACSGTIGGGRLEADVQAAAPRCLEKDRVLFIDFDLAGDPSVDEMDMICGGKMKVLLEPVRPDRQQQELWARLAEALEKREKVVLVSEIQGTLQQPAGLARYLVIGRELVAGPGRDRAGEIEDLARRLRKTRGPVMAQEPGRVLVAERMFPPGVVYIFGAGHVSRSLVTLAAMVDFRTVVLDDRSRYANRQRFPAADRIVVLDSFENAFRGLEIDTDSYIVIVTRGHSHDKTVLARALATGAGYIGMIGSTRKRDAIYKALLKEGFTEKRLAQVACPIGLEIGAETPEEIAVSIVGQLIETRTGGR